MIGSETPRFLLLFVCCVVAGCGTTEPPTPPPGDDDQVGDDDDSGGDDDDSGGDDDDSGGDDDDSGDDDDTTPDDDDTTSDDDDSGGDDDDVTPSCLVDAFEPNDVLAAAATVSLPLDEGFLYLCDYEEDWYALAGLVVTGLIDVEINNFGGSDLDLQLLGPDGDVVASSTGPASVERILHYVDQPGDYSVRVFVGEGAALPWVVYSLEITVDLAPSTCAADAFEPNQVAAGAPSITSTTYLGLTACAFDEDWYAIDAHLGDSLSFDLQYFAVEGNVNAWLYDSAGTVLVEAATEDDDELIEYAVTADDTLTLRVVLDSDGGFIPGNLYDLTLSGTTGPCVPDIYEPNDSLPGYWVPNGVYLAQTICPGDDDWYALDLTAAETFTFDLGYLASEGNVDVFLWDESATTQFASGTNTGDDENWSWLVAATGNYLLQVTLVADAGPMSGNVYDMDVSSVFEGFCPVDMFEPNDSAGSATWLPSLGNYPAMQVCVDEPDFFTFGALPDDEVDVVVDFDPTEGDVDLELFGPSGDLVDSAFGPGAPEILSAGESPGGIYTLGVYLSADFGSKDGINYDLDLLIIPPPGR